MLVEITNLKLENFTVQPWIMKVPRGLRLCIVCVKVTIVRLKRWFGDML